MALTAYEPDSNLLRQAFSSFPSGIAAISAVIDGEKVGLVASSFTVGVSLDPPLVLFAVQNSSTTWPILNKASSLGVSILGEAHDQVARQIASKTGNRFRDLSTHVAPSGALFVDAAPMWLECSIEQEVPAGDHHVVLLRITSLDVDSDINPLVFHGSRFRQLAQPA